MNEFLRSLHKEDEAMPGTVQELERQLGVRIVIADRTDPEEVGYVQWRTAFYIAGDLKNFLYLLDDWFRTAEGRMTPTPVAALALLLSCYLPMSTNRFKATAMAREQPYSWNAYPSK